MKNIFSFSTSKILLLFTILILDNYSIHAQVPTSAINIWNGKGPGSENIDIEERLNERTPSGDCDLDRTATNITEPELIPFTPNEPNGTSVIICPGGGYESLSYDVEGVDIAEWLNSLGITAFLLKYRLPADGHENYSDVPLQDAQRALRLVRYNSNSWALNPNKIGIIGFSAGGHVASSLGTGYNKNVYSRIDDIDDISARPNFMMLLYALISMEDALTHVGGRANLLGSNITTELINEYSTDKHVNASTPVSFIACAADDGSVDPENSNIFHEALQVAGVSSELHIYDDGGHGKGICRINSTEDFINWTTDCANWLTNLSTPSISATVSNMNFGSVELGTSTVLTYSISGSDLTDNVSINSTLGYQISLVSESGYSNSLTLAHTNGTLPSTNIYVRFSPTVEQIYNGNLSHESAGASQLNISLSGNGVPVQVPAITTSVENINFGSLEIGETTEQFYTIEGAHLTDDIVINAPEGFQISLTSGSNYFNSLTLPQTNGSITSTNIYVRFSPVLEQVYAGNITHTSIDANQVNITLNGRGVTMPTATATAIPGCNDTGTIRVSSDLTGEQTFYLFTSDGNTELANSGIINATFYDFVGQSDGIYSSRVEKGSHLSELSSQTTLTNGFIIEAPNSVGANSQEICSGSQTILSFSGGSGGTFVWYTSSCGSGLIGTGNNLVVSPTETTTYFGRWEDNCGQESSCLNITVTVSSTPQIPSSITGENNTCSNSAEVYSVADIPGTTYIWSLPEGWSGASSTNEINVTSGSEGGSIIVTPTNDCGNGPSQLLDVNVAKTTSIISQPEDKEASIGDEIELTVLAEGANLSYQWKFEDSDINGATSNTLGITSITQDNLGNYQVMVTGSCGEALSDIAQLSISTSFKELQKKNIKMYPNPVSNGILIIDTGIEYSKINMQVYNFNGKVVNSKQLTIGINEIDLSSLPKGTYLVLLKLDDNFVATKIITE